MFVPLFISSPEIIVILVITVMLFGAKKIPEIARELGKGMRQIKDATNDIKQEIQKSVDDEDFTRDFKEISQDFKKVKEDINKSAKPIKRDVGL